MAILQLIEGKASLVFPFLFITIIPLFVIVDALHANLISFIFQDHPIFT